MQIEHEQARYLEALTFLQAQLGLAPYVTTDQQALDIGYAICEEVARMPAEVHWSEFAMRQVVLLTDDLGVANPSIFGELSVEALCPQHTDLWFQHNLTSVAHMWDPDYWAQEGQWAP